MTTYRRILLLLLALSLLVGASGAATAKPDTTLCVNEVNGEVLTLPDHVEDHVENSPVIDCPDKKKPR